jgi:hypothetical protein
MTRHRTITITATALALAVSSAAPAAAGANSLLSGYGGPGQGNQAILGAALLGGPAGGGGTSGPAGAGSDAVGSGSAAGNPSGHAADPPALTKAGAGHGSGSTAKRAHSPGQAATGAAAVGHTPVIQTPYPASEAAADDTGSLTLGLSGADGVFILLAAGALASTAGLTRRLAREAR